MRKPRRLFSLLLAILFVTASMKDVVYAVDGVWHNPYGMDDLYESDDTERYPKDPKAGEKVYIKGTTWPVEWGQSVWVGYKLNGVWQKDVGADWKYNSDSNSYWEAAIGPFNKGDKVEYTVFANKDGQNQKASNTSTFTVTDWETADSVSFDSNENGRLVLKAHSEGSNFEPKLCITFPEENTLHFALAPTGDINSIKGEKTKYSVSDYQNKVIAETSKIKVTITKNPYAIEVYDKEKKKTVTGNSQANNKLRWLTDGKSVITKVSDTFDSPSDEKFYGFGEKYNSIEQRGKVVDTYVYNQYQNQDTKTYLSCPYFYSSRGYGLYLNTSCYSCFDMASTNKAAYTFTADTEHGLDSKLDYYMYVGNADKALNSYSNVSGKPQKLPKWAFGLWLSANEWDRQSEVLNAANQAENNDIPATVAVLEQWSDENTFYIWNDSTYKAVDGSKALKYSDFNFGDKWPDPKQMTNTLHNKGLKLILWQVPVLKYTDYKWEQKDNDEAYMVSKKYAVGDGHGGEYRTPNGTWFGNSLLLDFTNKEATKWWMSKRAYLFDDVGIDGFKTDGGEMVWGRDVVFSDGSTGKSMRNRYPNTYIAAYNDYSKEKTGTGMTFSRAGTSGAQTKGIYWAGDQSSTFASLKDSFHAGITAGISGVPYWSWDLAGFTGIFPNSELYKRSTEMAAFAPIMQFHSEKSNPEVSEERSPWNVQARTGDKSVVSHFSKYTNTRMNLLPYIYSEANKSTEDGSPLMRAMFIDFPQDENAYTANEQYMFGRNILVAPVLDEGAINKTLYLPQGNWINFFNNKAVKGGKNILVDAGVDDIPVYIKDGSIIPMNLNADYKMGSAIGNDVDKYTNLTFRVYPWGKSNYELCHNNGDKMQVSSEADFANGKVCVSVPKYDDKVTLQVYCTKPAGAAVGNKPLVNASSVNDLKKQNEAYYYDEDSKLLYVKLAKSAQDRVVEISGTSHVEAENVEHSKDGLGNVLSVKKNKNELELTVDNLNSDKDDILKINVCSDNILKVDYRPESVSESPDTPMIDPKLSWKEVNAEIKQSDSDITIKTKEMDIDIAKSPCRMTVKKADGTVLLWEPDIGGVKNGAVRFVRASSSNMYGMNAFDCFDDKGNLLRNDNTKAAAAGQQGNSGGPFMWSTAGYGLLVDADGGYPYTSSKDKKMEFYYGDDITEGRRYEKADTEYYVILGKPKDIMKGYSKITGKTPMMPKWSLGFMNFEWDINEKELRSNINTYRAKNIPLDAYAFDYDWKRYGADDYGEFTWNTNNFPSASSSKLKSELDADGVKMIGITKPRIVTKLENGQETKQGKKARENNYFYPGHYDYTDYFLPVTVRSVDFYNESARNWWWNSSKDAYDKGIVGWWNDETDKVSSNGADYWFGNFETMGISRAMYEGQRSYTKDKARVWQTARNFYPGTQRYGTSIWSGDVATQFYKGERVDWAAGLNEQKAALLSSINNGQVKWGTDGGGFNQNSGNIENPSPELYTRWLQFASVTPVFRVHGTNHHQRQPWYFGNTAEEAVKTAIHRRYSLIPYMYSYEREAYDSGVGLVRPLIYDYPDDDNVKDYSDAWMYGDWLLVAPITEKGLTSKKIYLPEGTWIDYNRGTKYQGGKYINYSLNAKSWTDLPMFVKAGAIIPTQEVLNHTGDKSITTVNLDVFPSNNTTSFKYYDDDGKTYSYENDTYYQQNISTKKVEDATHVDIGAKKGSYNPGLKNYIVAVHDQAATAVKVGNTSLKKYDSLESLEASKTEGFAVGKDVYGDVTYVKVSAGVEEKIVLSGHKSANIEYVHYEAEKASLSGETRDTMSSVSKEHSGYSGQGYVQGLSHDGSAVTFYVNVKNAGKYNFKLKYANGDTKKQSLSIYANGKYAKKCNLSSTGSWTDWSNCVDDLKLEAGVNAVTFKYDTKTGSTGKVNLDYLDVSLVPETIMVEAESAKLGGGAVVENDHNWYSGTGFVGGMVKKGASVSVSPETGKDSNYRLNIRYCNGTDSNKTCNLYVNGTFLKTLTFAENGGDWNKWNELITTIPLVKGKNTIEVKFDANNTGNINLDSFTLSLDESETDYNLVDNGSFERDSSNQSAWTEWHPYGQEQAYGIDSGSGSNPPESAIEGNNRAYFYNANAYKQSIHQKINLPNGKYRVTAWVKVSNSTPNTGRMEISEFGDSTKYVNMPSAGEGWKLIECEFNITSGFVDIGFYFDAKGGTTVHIDDVSLTKVR